LTDLEPMILNCLVTDAESVSDLFRAEPSCDELDDLCLARSQLFSEGRVLEHLSQHGSCHTAEGTPSSEDAIHRGRELMERSVLGHYAFDAGRERLLDERRPGVSRDQNDRSAGAFFLDLGEEF